MAEQGKSAEWVNLKRYLSHVKWLHCFSIIFTKKNVCPSDDNVV